MYAIIDRYPDGCYASDQIERPVRTPGGHTAIVVHAPDESHVTVRAWACRGDLGYGFVGEPATLPLVDCQPLCVHCEEPLRESDYEGPGSCVNPTCFLYRGETDDD